MIFTAIELHTVTEKQPFVEKNGGDRERGDGGSERYLVSSRVRVSSTRDQREKEAFSGSVSVQAHTEETTAASALPSRPTARTFWPLLTRHRGIYSREKKRGSSGGSGGGRSESRDLKLCSPGQQRPG